MMDKDKVAFVGGGNMTLAIAGGLLASGFAPNNILIAEPLAKQRAKLEEQLPGVLVSADNAGVSARAACVVLAVKPQLLADVCSELANALQETRPLIVSIAAGVRGSDIDAWLGGDFAIVRVMPNQPALLRLGVSGIYANDKTDAVQLAMATEIMAAVGSVVSVGSEDDIDAVTAVSGSGPAYFFLLIDILAQTAHDFGLDEQAARTLAVDTATGAAALAAANTESMDVLIARVRSPGGTTEAALDSLEQGNVRAIFAEALMAARDRGKHLADEAGK